jgi:hypothetical protein
VCVFLLRFFLVFFCSLFSCSLPQAHCLSPLLERPLAEGMAVSALGETRGREENNTKTNDTRKLYTKKSWGVCKLECFYSTSSIPYWRHHSQKGRCVNISLLFLPFLTGETTCRRMGGHDWDMMWEHKQIQSQPVLLRVSTRTASFPFTGETTCRRGGW